MSVCSSSSRTVHTGIWPGCEKPPGAVEFGLFDEYQDDDTEDVSKVMRDPGYKYITGTLEDDAVNETVHKNAEQIDKYNQCRAGGIMPKGKDEGCKTDGYGRGNESTQPVLEQGAEEEFFKKCSDADADKQAGVKRADIHRNTAGEVCENLGEEKVPSKYEDCLSTKCDEQEPKESLVQSAGNAANAKAILRPCAVAQPAFNDHVEDEGQGKDLFKSGEGYAKAQVNDDDDNNFPPGARLGLILNGCCRS